MQTWAQVLTRTRGGCVIHRCQNKIPDRKVDQWMWMTSCTGSACGGFGGFWKSQLSWDFASEEDGWLSWSRRGLVSGAHVVWGWWKSQVYLSPYVEKALDSKVIKSFEPELRSVFRVSGFPCSMYICYEHSMYVSHISIMGMLYDFWILHKLHFLFVKYWRIYVKRNKKKQKKIIMKIKAKTNKKRNV